MNPAGLINLIMSESFELPIGKYTRGSPLLIGRSSECNVQIKIPDKESPLYDPALERLLETISRIHGELVYDNDGIVYIKNVSKNSVIGIGDEYARHKIVLDCRDEHQALFGCILTFGENYDFKLLNPTKYKEYEYTLKKKSMADTGVFKHSELV